LVDAYKTCFARSFSGRRKDPVPITVSAADVLAGQNDSFTVADRRFLGRAVGELFASVVHPGGVTGAALPPVTAKFVGRELCRYADAGYVEPDDGSPPQYRLGLTMATFAGSLFSWISLLSLHDIQLTGWDNGRAVGQEEVLLFITTETTVWT